MTWWRWEEAARTELQNWGFCLLLFKLAIFSVSLLCHLLETIRIIEMKKHIRGEHKRWKRVQDRNAGLTIFFLYNNEYIAMPSSCALKGHAFRKQMRMHIRLEHYELLAKRLHSSRCSDSFVQKPATSQSYCFLQQHVFAIALFFWLRMNFVIFLLKTASWFDLFLTKLGGREVLWFYLQERRPMANGPTFILRWSIFFFVNMLPSNVVPCQKHWRLAKTANPANCTVYDPLYRTFLESWSSFLTLGNFTICWSPPYIKPPLLEVKRFPNGGN